MRFIDKVKNCIDKQYGRPKGLIGTYIGEKMVQQHKPETLWTIELLNVNKNDHILELGCGSGYAMKLILEQKQVDQVVGFDISPTVIRTAKIRNKKALNEGKVKIVQGTVKKLPFEDEVFNKVFSIHSIYFWEDLSDTISEIDRVLSRSGKLILTLSDGKNGETWEGIRDLIEGKVIPLLKGKGFIDVELIKGPNSREYHTVAVIGKKSSYN
ncbi:class I SAM-dependent methyltransferase [Mesobacillus maritimus]|uniref:class I SAM-dependent methyltransferase n=1 Tax=Mesobacillus maritimus TaxID=1643336 RepID=UPI00203E0B7F|nr:class I SAM-dependent methyltransferase [Mesobacillus maritimus]MCM3588918.1 class I SAM-dependent methyltransferase [Mesobacillus maritimus]